MIARLFGASFSLLPEDPLRRFDLGERHGSEPMLLNLRNQLRRSIAGFVRLAIPLTAVVVHVLPTATNVTSPPQTMTLPSDPAGRLEAVRSENKQAVTSSDPIPPLDTSRRQAAAGAAPLRASVVSG